MPTSKGQKVPSNNATSAQVEKPPSKDKIVKEGWGSRTNFQASYGLKMTPEDLEEGNKILEAMQQADSKE